MAATTVYLEIGAKKTFACATAWPGWCRSGRDEAAALEQLAAYAVRYAPVARRAGVRFPQSAARAFEVVERRKGSASTDFGALDGPTASDFDEPLTAREAARLAAIVEAADTTFWDVVHHSSPTLQKGPRGGGRDRDAIARHVLDAEASYARKIGVRQRAPAIDDTSAIAANRDEVVATLRAARTPVPDLTSHGAPGTAGATHGAPGTAGATHGAPGTARATKAWPYRYLARRIAWHLLDHAWEIEDKRQ
jgi:hypothetical protein